MDAEDTIASRDHATALRSIQNNQTFCAVLHRGNSGFAIDCCNEKELCHGYSIYMRPKAPERPLTEHVKIALKRGRFFSSSTAKNAFEEASAKASQSTSRATSPSSTNLQQRLLLPILRVLVIHRRLAGDTETRTYGSVDLLNFS